MSIHGRRAGYLNMCACATGRDPFHIPGDDRVGSNVAPPPPATLFSISIMLYLGLYYERVRAPNKSATKW
jgi:hypothetical protein